MTEPTTPTGRAFVGVDEMHEYTQSHRRAIAEDIEREAAAAERERLRAALMAQTAYPMEVAIGNVLGYPDFMVWALLADPEAPTDE